MTVSSPIPPPVDKPLTPMRCFSGAAIATVLAALLYGLTTAVVQSLISHPTHSNNPLIVNLSAAVRTLVIGGMTLGTGIFALVAIGLLGLGLQLAVRGWRAAKTQPDHPPAPEPPVDG